MECEHLHPYWLKKDSRFLREFALDFARFWRGYIPYLVAGRNNWGAFYALRRLFCVTNGRLNDGLTALHRLTHRPYPIHLCDSMIPGLTRETLGHVARTIRRNGYYIFARPIPEDISDNLLKFALATPMSVMREDGKMLPGKLSFDPGAPVGIKYDADMQTIMESAAVQRVVADPGLLGLAQAYFGAKATQDMAAMWWSVPSLTPSSAAAQLFHFDMDRVKFLKFFIYLTDVDADNGPHCFISGSHRRLPTSLRQDKRHTDEEVFAHYARDKYVEMHGRKGTLVAVDTRGLHKGKALRRGNRLIFQVEFSINLFGMHYPPVRLNDKFSPAFRDFLAKYPYAFANYVADA